MSEQAVFSSVDIEEKITAAGDKFTLASVARALGAPRSDALRRRLERFIESDNTFFHDRKWNCIKRSAFFNGTAAERLFCTVCGTAGSFAALFPAR